MIHMAPPRLPPRASVADGDSLDRLRFRLWQILITAVTVLLTGWCCTLGPIAAIAAVMVAKHILVAVFVMGMDYRATNHPRGQQRSQPPLWHDWETIGPNS